MPTIDGIARVISNGHPEIGAQQLSPVVIMVVATTPVPQHCYAGC